MSLAEPNDAVASAPLSPSRCVHLVRAEARALASAAEAGLEARVPRYPGWTVADLVVHTGLVHRWAERIVRERATEPLPRDAPPPSRDEAPALLGWFREGADRLAATLEAAEPTTPVWSFTGPSIVAFWLRRMAHETAMHRWDAQSAHGCASPFAPDVAQGGIDESLVLHLPRGDEAVRGSGERVALVCTEDASMRPVLVIDPSGDRPLR